MHYPDGLSPCDSSGTPHAFGRDAGASLEVFSRRSGERWPVPLRLREPLAAVSVWYCAETELRLPIRLKQPDA